ncbi:MAG: hypothetical protein JRG95_14220 [Deltaproteobacteria bacterium]|nr:hypothetical protein [Deltaproteobacteria bacterium]
MKMNALVGCLVAIGLLVGGGAFATTPDTDQAIDRSVLPIQRPAAAPITEMDARNAIKPARFEVNAPSKPS